MPAWHLFARRSQTLWLVSGIGTGFHDRWRHQRQEQRTHRVGFIGITQRCSGCIGFHVKALHKLGCSRAELEEMLAVCVYMGGGPALMYAAEAIKAWEMLA